MAAGVKSFITKIQDLRSAAGIAARTDESREWYRKRMQATSNLNRKNLLKDPRLTPRNEQSAGKPQIGRMYMFQYDPKGAETLPYYDTYPLILMVGPAGGNGFYGLNLHYLPIKLRALFFDKLTAFINNEKYDDTTKIKLSYQLLSSAGRLREFAPCFKKYLFDQLDTRLFEVHPSDWELALYLPIDHFVGQPRKNVWGHSKRAIASGGTTKTSTAQTSHARTARTSKGS